MTVWLVGISNCEENCIVYLCTTKELAVKRLFEERDKLVKDWEETRDSEIFKDHGPQHKEMYQEMIDALSGNDYEKWDNFPHDAPYIQERTVEME